MKVGRCAVCVCDRIADPLVWFPRIFTDDDPLIIILPNVSSGRIGIGHVALDMCPIWLGSVAIPRAGAVGTEKTFCLVFG